MIGKAMLGDRCHALSVPKLVLELMSLQSGENIGPSLASAI